MYGIQVLTLDFCKDSYATDNSQALDRFGNTDDSDFMSGKRKLYEIMIGDDHLNSRKDDSFFTVELEKLSEDKVIDIYRKCGGNGFAVSLKPYLVDLLKRRENFQSVVDMFALAVHKDNKQTRPKKTTTIPHLLLELTPKDIFIALLEVMPDAVHSRLVSLYSSLYCAVPVAYVLQLPRGDVRTVINFKSLQDVLAVPSYPLVVSCGTTNAVRKGKSTLMGKLVGQLKTTSLSFHSFDVCSDEGDGELCHSPSIDLLLEIKSNVQCGLNFADVHGFTKEKTFCHALSTLCSVAALVLVHVTANDFGPRGSLGHSLRSFVLNSCKLLSANAEIVIFVRDVPNSTKMSASFPQPSQIRQSLREILPNRTAQVVLVEDLANCRAKRQRQMTVISIGDQMAPIFRNLKKRLPCSEVVEERFVSCCSGQARNLVSHRRESSKLDGFSSLGRKTYEALEASKQEGGEIANRLFPLTAIYAAKANIIHRRKQLCENRNKEKGNGVDVELVKLQNEEAELDTRRQTISSISRPVELFRSLVSDKNHHQLAEFQHYLEVWKAQYIDPLLEKRRELMKQMKPIKRTDEKESKEQTQHTIASVERELKEISSRIDQFDISLDSFWSELMELCALRENDTTVNVHLRKLRLDPQLTKQVYTQCVLEGYPIQLLRGNPLQMTASTFIEDIMKQLGIELKNRSNLLVVSVIGAQSSAKSTLLNYLFGCGFATRAGRCTKGLYASFVRISDGRYLLVLDSEGLLSLEGGGHVFDGQITVMAMACSDAVIVNHKGEISSQMRKLLEVCLYAMDYLKVADMRPEMMFVLRDQIDRTTKVQSDSLTLMKDMLREAMGNEEKNLDDLVSLRQDAIFLLPSAFSEVKLEGRTVKLPTGVFSEEAFFLRRKILQSTLGDRSTLYPRDGTDSLVSWYSHACIVWTTLTEFGHTLLHYKALYELNLHKQINEIVTSLVKQAEEEFNDQAGTVVKKLTRQLQKAKDKTVVQGYDVTCRTDLETLKKTSQDKLVRDFEECTQAEKFNEDLKKEFRFKLTTPLSSSYDMNIYSWGIQLHLANERLNVEDFDQRFYDQLNEKLERTEYRSPMSASEAAKVFDELWKQHEIEHKKRLLATRKRDFDVELDVVRTFRDGISRNQHNELLHAVALEFSSSELSKSTDFVTNSDEIWFRKYFKINYSFVQKAHRYVFSTEDKGLAKSLAAVQQLKSKVHNLQQRLVNRIESQEGGGKCDATIATDIVVLATDEVLKMESGLHTSDKRLKLQRAPFINDLIVHLQQVAYRVVCSAENKRILEQEEELEQKRASRRKHFIDTASNEANDVKCAAAFAEEYSEQLKLWVKSKVGEFASEVSKKVSKEFPNPEKAAERAYYSSFKVNNYDGVLEYCIDVNAYLKKLFMQMFEEIKQGAIDKNKYELRDSISAMYAMLEDAAERWKQSGPTTSHGFIDDFKNHLTKRTKDPSEVGDRDLLETALVWFPPMNNFPITRIDIFCERFKRRVNELLHEVLDHLDGMVTTSMSDQCSRLWATVKGCRSKCPLCGSKCSLVYEHPDHYCAHHIFPAFHGTKVRDLKHPVFDMCLSTSNANSGWYRGDDPPLPNLKEYLEYYDDYRPWKKFIVSNPRLEQEPPAEQIQAWVVCRKPLLKYWGLVNKTPEDWLLFDNGNPLDENECYNAEARLKKYRDI